MGSWVWKFHPILHIAILVPAVEEQKTNAQLVANKNMNEENQLQNQGGGCLIGDTNTINLNNIGFIREPEGN